MERIHQGKHIHEIRDDHTTSLQFDNIDSSGSRTDLEPYIRDLDRHIRIHFVLQRDMVSFIKKLPKRIRRFKTVAKKNSNKVHGHLNGKIEWHKTIRYRYSQNPIDKTNFIIDRINRDYNLSENIVLKELLSIINTIVSEDLVPTLEHHNEYPWLKKLVMQNGLEDVIRDIYLKNIYITRITNKDDLQINERMISNALKSRNPLYREAASLLRSYRKLMNLGIEHEGTW